VGYAGGRRLHVPRTLAPETTSAVSPAPPYKGHDMYTKVCLHCGSSLFRDEIKRNRRVCYPNCGGDEMPPGPKPPPKPKIMAGETEIKRNNEPPEGEFVEPVPGRR